jgi:hypothetical protein
MTKTSGSKKDPRFAMLDSLAKEQEMSSSHLKNDPSLKKCLSDNYKACGSKTGTETSHGTSSKTD